jgi:hypothetical protein
MRRLLKKVSVSGKVLAKDLEEAGNSTDLVLESGQKALTKICTRLAIVGGVIVLGWSSAWEAIDAGLTKTQETIDASGVKKIEERKTEAVFHVRGRRDANLAD